ncbi:nicotinate-nucleotide adenylyltransferase [Calderihabitans maritimus]|uniref:Probable nicotinate-nucleotide adenylyltransferase n=1 Tax=Calderihabitans maritimus TaxID=1246530 RepID=A0A1Z5HUZ7_9FIRM|nr:nicotinate-nucleotide adenylyltransferase [Calderihabitans maritimus]GAW93342.1 nicotinic acid mononucleotide adenylyltransferase [Calderihabitans maritimus]
MAAKLGIMGGTFDPIHYGHLVAAEAVRYKFGLDKVIFVPSGRPPHKKGQIITESRHRYLMTVLAVATNPFFEVSRTEIERKGYSYAIDTVRQFQRIYPKHKIFFITGADAILQILTWKNVDELVRLCQFVAVTRPGFNLGEVQTNLSLLPEEYRRVIHFMEVPALAISSTDIRRRVKTGEPIKYLLPEPVEYYIYKNNLYKEEP